jgi:hypothetical protein
MKPAGRARGRNDMVRLRRTAADVSRIRYRLQVLRSEDEGTPIRLKACCLILLQAPDVPLQFSDKNQSQ